jgi:uncharacterized protein YndB with AHSA1/START domain
MTFAFDATPAGSRVTIVTQFSSIDAMEQTIPGMQQGLRAAMPQLDALLAATPHVTMEADGRRSIASEVVVPGTDAEVWQAIATGPGVSSWFVPAVFEEKDGKPAAMQLTFGPGMAPRSAITAWDPPRMYAAQGDGWGGSPPMTITWHVDPRADGTCRLRVVNSLVASDETWDALLIASAQTWPGFFRILQQYMTHFRGQPAALVQCVAPVSGSEAEAWDAFTTALGLHAVRVGEKWTAPADAPAAGGLLEHLTRDPYDALLRCDQPGPGLLALGAFSFGGQSMVALNFYRYGDQAATDVAAQQPLWQAWIAAQCTPGT